MISAEKKPEGYRWVVLAALMMITLMSQIQWLSHAPVARAADTFYKGHFNPSSFFNVDFLANSYMIFYLVVSIPASYFTARYGIKKGITAGAVLSIAGGVLKAAAGPSFIIVISGQILLAIGQPFVINSSTALSAQWFPVRERALATGFATLAQYIGILIAMLVTPMLIVHSPSDPHYGSGIDRMLMIYGIVTFVLATAGIFLLKERPQNLFSDEESVRISFREGLKRIFSLRDMWLMIILFTIGLGIFNAISSMEDSIAAYLGVDDSNGMIGGIMLIGGIIGAVIIPLLSDYFRKRKLFIVMCIFGMLPGVAGLALAPELTGGHGVNPDAAYTIALISSFLLGFFVMSAGPVGFQYSAEVSHPAPESTSQGLLLWVGQLSGIILVSGMSIRNKAFLPGFMISFVVITLIAVIMVSFIKESKIIIAEREKTL
jgi:MFS family permease